MYIRIGIHTPRAGSFDEVKALQERVVAELKNTPGCREAYVLADAKTNRVGRLSTWDDEDSAEAAAMRTETMALRSQIGLLTADDGIESGFIV